MTTHAGSIFDPNRTQAVRLPAETRFPPGVRRVMVRVRGVERILAPADQAWDRYFLSGEGVTEGFPPQRADQRQDEREAF